MSNDGKVLASTLSRFLTEQSESLESQRDSQRHSSALKKLDWIDLIVEMLHRYMKTGRKEPLLADNLIGDASWKRGYVSWVRNEEVMSRIANNMIY
jgi:hypothetical protein